ncbi:CGLD27 family protein [Gloeothece verrucosa]|uniref:Ycf36 protein n=1 Tax=Gloeothece verrucosa (strain PCC 7822) TaxID=497965 RepID=E0UHG9_GLOV7|nr:CGLD27 family protein [Gloeothece verrucosa]ADN12110.1 protein of unknown function DUF1230 [Gloeothece verrucosa PCC 7822]
MKGSYREICPVPSEQQPVNEYEQLKESWFFCWATLEPVPYWRKLGWVWLWSWILVGPIAATSFPLQKKPLLFVLSAIVGTCLIVGLVLLRLYLGWFYISDRLNAEQVFYEESGWYDGQIWQKTPEVLIRDRLILSYQVEPILKRIKKTALVLASLIGSSSLLWFCLENI